MKENNMIPQNPLEKFFTDRNLSDKTRVGYNRTLQQFEKITNKTLPELLQIANTERNNDWGNTQLLQWLITYRNHVYNEYKEKTADLYLGRVKAVFRHYHIPVSKLPYFSTKHTRKSEEIDYEDLPNREMLKKAIELKSPLLKAVTLFMSSSGFSKIDTLALNVSQYLDATREYHHCNDIYQAIQLMEDQDVVPTFKLNRHKTGETYRTFASPEAIKAINIYLMSREDTLNLESKIFKISESYINDIFQQTNDTLGFGRVNDRRRFTPQMLRSYQATQLSEAGMNDSHIDLIQGRKPQSVARKSYIRVKRESLKEEYIRCLPYLVVEDISKVKTKLDLVTEEKESLEIENEELKKQNARIDNLEKLVLGNISEDDWAKLDKIL